MEFYLKKKKQRENYLHYKLIPSSPFHNDIPLQYIYHDLSKLALHIRQLEYHIQIPSILLHNDRFLHHSGREQSRELDKHLEE
jgi:hypothetical protein